MKRLASITIILFNNELLIRSVSVITYSHIQAFRLQMWKVVQKR